MYGTGQYDLQILQELQSLDSTLTALSPVINGINSAVNTISSVVSSISDNWLPILTVGVLVLSIVSVVKWVVKL